MYAKIASMQRIMMLLLRVGVSRVKPPARNTAKAATTAIKHASQTIEYPSESWVTVYMETARRIIASMDRMRPPFSTNSFALLSSSSNTNAFFSSLLRGSLNIGPCIIICGCCMPCINGCGCCREEQQWGQRVALLLTRLPHFGHLVSGISLFPIKNYQCSNKTR